MSESVSLCYLVLAGTLEEARQWARDHGLPVRPHHRNGWVYASSPEAIHGIQGMTVKTVGTFYLRRDRHRIRELVDLCVISGHLVEEFQ